MSNVSKTVNRGWLKKQIAAGKMLIKCDYKMTDDYAFDAATNFGKTGWKPARYAPNKYSQECKYAEDVIFVDDFDLKSKSGCAYQREGGEIALIVYNGYSLTLKSKE